MLSIIRSDGRVDALDDQGPEKQPRAFPGEDGGAPGSVRYLRPLARKGAAESRQIPMPFDGQNQGRERATCPWIVREEIGGGQKVMRKQAVTRSSRRFKTARAYHFKTRG
jgi:hypothetical protein